MEYPHRIRLRGPWECAALSRLGLAGDEAPLPAPLRVTMPCRWRETGLGDFGGRVRCRRAFGYPGQIDTTERVWLTFAGVTGLAEVWVNGSFLGRHEGAGDPFEHEVTGLLQVRNRLVVEVEDATGQGGLWGEVALEIRRTAFLRAVRAWAEAAGGGTVLHAAGAVVGTSERPLDLYVLLGGRTAAYTTVEAAPDGRPFHVTSEHLDEARFAATGEGPSAARPVRVELVDAAIIWYTVEQFCDFPAASNPS